ncbi:MAG: S-methyl-5-thioribose-1-phosphate isomerase [Ruminiclostridium sp.]|nr:S-methyl-5-thioribose-1-phosphate isomerase [Ruminiclostridium sp.]
MAAEGKHLTDAERKQYEPKDWSGLTSLFNLEKTEHEDAELLADDLVKQFENKVGDEDVNALWDAIRAATDYNLKHALDRVEKAAAAEQGSGREMILSAMRRECIAVQDEDIAMCRAISEYGLTLVKDGFGVLTHCNAGPLATSCYGTGLGTLLLGKERGYTFHAYVDETRPLLQGARLTSYELGRAGIDVTLICDNMASIVMKQGRIDACFVGCDRVAANGDAANKIGTSGVAILAGHYGIPFYVFCPSSTIDLNCKTGADIVIEERQPDEIKTKFFTEPVAPASVKCYNPAFDVTDAELITAIITEKGIFRYPYTESLTAMFSEK